MQWFMRDGVNTPNVGVIRHPRHRFVNLLLFIHHTTHVIDIFRQLWTRVDYLETIQSPLFLWCTDVLARLTRHEASTRHERRDLTRACQCASAVHQTKNGERGRLARVVSGEVCGPPRVRAKSRTPLSWSKHTAILVSQTVERQEARVQGTSGAVRQSAEDLQRCDNGCSVSY